MIEQLHEVIGDIEHEWANQRLLVVGDVMLDTYIWGEVGRISPEAPVPVVRAIDRSHRPGGAANVAMNLARLGAQTVLAGFTGSDENEKLLAESLRANGIAPIFVACDGFPTITKQRILGGQQQMLRLDSERMGARSPGDYDLLVSRRRRCARQLFRPRAGWTFRCWSIPRARISRGIAARPPSARTWVSWPGPCSWMRAT